MVPHWHGSDMKIHVSQAKTRWIFELGCLAPAGLNLDIDLNCLTDF